MFEKKTKELFESHMKKVMVANKSSDFMDDSSTLDNEHHHMESCKLNLDEVKVSENFALSDIQQLHVKCQKTQHLTPVMTAFVDISLGKSKLHKIRVLLDTGSSGSLILENM